MNRRWILRTMLATPLGLLAAPWLRGRAKEESGGSVFKFETTDADGIILDEAPEVAPAAAMIFAREVAQREDGCPVHYRVVKTGELVPAEEIGKVVYWNYFGKREFQYTRVQSLSLSRLKQVAWTKINYRDGELEPVREYSAEEGAKLWPEKWVATHGKSIEELRSIYPIYDFVAGSWDGKLVVVRLKSEIWPLKVQTVREMVWNIKQIEQGVEL